MTEAKRNDEAFADRVAELREQESLEPDGWWWLSFVDGERPAGQQFLGACLVRAQGFLGAVAAAHFLSINPGGEVQGMGPIPLTVKIQSGWTERLLTRAECEEFDRVHEGQLS